jgi:hypothetical protein
MKVPITQDKDMSSLMPHIWVSMNLSRTHARAIEDRGDDSEGISNATMY